MRCRCKATAQAAAALVPTNRTNGHLYFPGSQVRFTRTLPTSAEELCARPCRESTRNYVVSDRSRANLVYGESGRVTQARAAGSMALKSSTWRLTRGRECFSLRGALGSLHSQKRGILIEK